MQDRHGTSPVHLRFRDLHRSQARVIRRRFASGPVVGGDPCGPPGGDAWVCWMGVKDGWCGLPDAMVCMRGGPAGLGVCTAVGGISTREVEEEGRSRDEMEMGKSRMHFHRTFRDTEGGG